jgi:hypothetical protein
VGVLIQIMKMSGGGKKPAKNNQIQMTKRGSAAAAIQSIQ